MIWNSLSLYEAKNFSYDTCLFSYTFDSGSSGILHSYYPCRSARRLVATRFRAGAAHSLLVVGIGCADYKCTLCVALSQTNIV